jgi:hypothetical protein
VGLAWNYVRCWRCDIDDIKVSGLFDFYWFDKWAPDIDSWLKHWHNIPRRPRPFAGDNTAMLLDLNNKKLRREAHDSLAIHLTASPKHHFGYLHNDREHILGSLSQWMKVSPHSIFIESGPRALGNYALLLQPGSAPVVPRWERVTEEEHKAMEDAKDHPERSEGGIGNDQWSIVATSFMRRMSLSTGTIRS